MEITLRNLSRNMNHTPKGFRQLAIRTFDMRIRLIRISPQIANWLKQVRQNKLALSQCVTRLTGRVGFGVP